MSDPRFQGVKSSILKGTPRLVSHLVENDAMNAILSAAPKDHHVFVLSCAEQQDGRLAIVLTAKLYGVSFGMPLAVDVPKPHKAFPVFFLVDYLNHEVKEQSLVEYSEYLCGMGIA